MKKRIFAVVLSLALVIGMVSVISLPAFAITGGTTGDCTWSFDGTTLTISGCGEMDDYDVFNVWNRPWYGFADAIETVIITNGVTHIGNLAFRECSSLTSISIPDSVTSIGEYAFGFCSSLNSITIPASVASIGDSAFSNCTSLTAVHISDLAKWCQIDFSDFYCNPLYWAHKLYVNGKLVTDLIIPDTATIVKSYAFIGCESLTSATIGNSVISIGDYAFSDCKSLKSITISDSVTSMGDSVFENCASLINTTISNSVTSIGNLAFRYCASLTSITIPNSVTSIGNNAFEECTSLININISNNVTSIGRDAFYGCTALKSITIPNSVTSIGDWAFRDCTALSNIVLPSTPMTIELFAFCNTAYANNNKNWNNHALYIGNHLIEVDDEYKGVLTLKEGTIDVSDYAFLFAYNVTGVVVPASVLKINDRTIGWVWVGEHEWEKQDKFIISGEKGTAAEKYAKENGFAFIEGNPPTKDAAKDFSDVKKSSWFYKAVNYAYNEGLFGGTSATTFAPNTNMTRGMFVTVLGRLAGVSSAGQTTKFKDVKKSAYYSGYVKWASDKGIVGGTSATTFEPDANVTREQICKMMVEYCKAMSIALGTPNKEIKFADAAKISSWARTYVKTCQRAGLVNGKENNKFDPQGNATRAEVATILYNFNQNY